MEKKKRFNYFLCLKSRVIHKTYTWLKAKKLILETLSHSKWTKLWIQFLMLNLLEIVKYANLLIELSLWEALLPLVCTENIFQPLFTRVQISQLKTKINLALNNKLLSKLGQKSNNLLWENTIKNKLKSMSFKISNLIWLG